MVNNFKNTNKVIKAIAKPVLHYYLIKMLNRAIKVFVQFSKGYIEQAKQQEVYNRYYNGEFKTDDLTRLEDDLFKSSIKKNGKSTTLKIQRDNQEDRNDKYTSGPKLEFKAKQDNRVTNKVTEKDIKEAIRFARKEIDALRGNH
ncbi:hypothetical protein DOS74_03115 [Staphylococcus felis]|uniref:Uncharacterized protein n=1 Tax=Staphylococcus felis TaxID=46127 RepID=A0A3E0IKR5_9STAP|nr:hypothetical protein [Staphylococcus felis]REH82319.1 hypothetical protein DOS61_09695 [Staphylococcus felis]REH89012.1 hypothetical protein DOS83_13800 [Staphylococcus felis]REH92868.1 hypothetical protein DOS58_00430 [Staphylococcus felis]REI15167.1 hypothetical protein DOS75_09905 [Staphylococcus felis]REI17862.1 hypothetical protein DOS74_03115 [Staphylococcus felis]